MARIHSTVFSGLIIFFFFSHGLFSQQGDGFEWSWKKENGEPQPVAKEPQPSRDSADGFNWSWQEDGKTGPSTPLEAASSGVTTAEYRTLLNQNLSLRKEIDGLRNDIQKLQSNLGERDRKIATLAGVIDKQQGAQPASSDAQKLLEEEVESLKLERRLMNDELSKLHAKIKSFESDGASAAESTSRNDNALVAQLTEEIRKLEAEIKRLKLENSQQLARQKELESKETQFAEGSAGMQSQNDQLKRKLADMESRLQLAEDAAKAVYKDKKRIEAELDKQIQKARAYEQRLASVNEHIALMDTHVERSEQRMMVQEGAYERVRQAQEDVNTSMRQELLSTHYNMAVMHAQAGDYKQALADYMAALRVDPENAAVHYNLGVLYDDYLDNSRRALLHYRKYIELDPEATDLDQVKSWIYKLEMSLK